MISCAGWVNQVEWQIAAGMRPQGELPQEPTTPYVDEQYDWAINLKVQYTDEQLTEGPNWLFNNIQNEPEIGVGDLPLVCR